MAISSIAKDMGKKKDTFTQQGAGVKAKAHKISTKISKKFAVVCN